MPASTPSIRCFARPGAWGESAITLDAAESHHLLRVLRARGGQAVEALDGQGRRAEAYIEHATRQGATLRIARVTRLQRPCPGVVLAPALVKKGAFEALAQKAIELGVEELMPVISARTVAREPPGAAGGRTARRFQALAMAALKQSGHAWLPDISPPCDWTHLLDRIRTGPEICCYGSLEPGAPALKDWLRQWATPPERLMLCVGPEGDYTPAEWEALRESGAAPVGLGEQVLRVDTAALFMLAAVRYEYARTG